MCLSWERKIVDYADQFSPSEHMIFSPLGLKRTQDHVNLIDKWLFSQMWCMRRKSDCELMLSLSVSVVLECPTTVCDFLSWSYSHALLVKPVYMTAGPSLLSSCLWWACEPQRKSHYSDTTTVDLAHTDQKQKGICFDYCCSDTKKKKR